MVEDIDDMNDGRVGPRGRAGRPRRRRAGPLAAAVAGATLLAAACSGSPAGANTFAPGATYAQALAFAKCMRANGVPGFPAPDAQGNFNNTQIEALAEQQCPGRQRHPPVPVSAPERGHRADCRADTADPAAEPPQRREGRPLHARARDHQLPRPGGNDTGIRRQLAARAIGHPGRRPQPEHPLLRGRVHDLQRQAGRRAHPAGLRPRAEPPRAPVRTATQVTATGLRQRVVSGVNRHRLAPARR